MLAHEQCDRHNAAHRREHLGHAHRAQIQAVRAQALDPRAAEAILDFWSSDWEALAAKLRADEVGLRPRLQELPILKMDRHLFQLPWMQAMQDNQLHFQTQIDRFLARASGGENPAQVAQEVLDFLFEHQMTSKLPPVDLSVAQQHVRTISDEAFEILNTLQFQDITRQKVEKVVLLLKQFKEGLNRLLAIFKIETEEGTGEKEIFEHRQTATQDKIFETSLNADDKKQSVEDIIAQFKKGQA